MLESPRALKVLHATDFAQGQHSSYNSFYGMLHEGLFTPLAVTPGNVVDCQMLGPLIDPHAQEVTADKGYDADANHQRLKHNGQRASIIIKDNRTNPEVIGQANPQSQRERLNIERKFAEQGTPLKLCPSCEGGKKHHGLSQARHWGQVKVTIQASPSHCH